MQDKKPLIWLIVGDKLGDNAQVDVLAETLGLPTVRKRLQFKDRWVYGKPRFKASLYHIDQAHSERLEPPWPDLVITIGRRPAMAALWVKRQSGGRTKIVLFGRPKRYLNEFDLVIAAGQYHMPNRPNVLKLDLPLMRADPGAVTRATREWQDRLANMPRPLTAVLVGGATKPFRLEPEDARELIRQVRVVTGDAGSLYVSTSRRTSAAAADALEEALPVNSRFYRWTPGSPASANPYLALLGSADHFVVTGDSISMMVEAARIGKPVLLAPLPFQSRLPWLQWMRLSRKIADGLRCSRFATHVGKLAWSRDYYSFYDRLCAWPHINLLEEGLPKRKNQVSLRDSAEIAAAAVGDLLSLNRGDGRVRADYRIETADCD